MAKYQIEVLFGDIVIATINTKPERYPTDAFEIAPTKILGEEGKGRNWETIDHDDKNHKVRFTDGKFLFTTRLIKYGESVTDFDEEDKPRNRAQFTVFAGGDPIPCNDASSAARTMAQALFGMNRIRVS